MTQYSTSAVKVRDRNARRRNTNCSLNKRNFSDTVSWVTELTTLVVVLCM